MLRRHPAQTVALTHEQWVFEGWEARDGPSDMADTLLVSV